MWVEKASLRKVVPTRMLATLVTYKNPMERQRKAITQIRVLTKPYKSTSLTLHYLYIGQRGYDTIRPRVSTLY